jgi:predicted GH43/DUF377 family glycosyl hydrolase
MRKILLFTLAVLCCLTAESQSAIMRYGDTSRTGLPCAKDPYVIKYKGAYWLYYSIPAAKGQAKGWGIGVAKSYNLKDWTKQGEINASPTSVLEKNGICSPCAIVRNDTVHLFYQTYGNGASDAICHAYSTDAVHFERDATNPIYHPSGDWTCGRAIDADVHLYKGKYYLYYATRDKQFQIQQIGVATTSARSSFARSSWTGACKEAVLAPTLPWEGKCIEAPTIITRNNRMYMFYGGNYNNAPQQIGVAQSSDGIHWTRCSDKPFMKNGLEGEWNSSETGHPGILDNGKTSYLFYQGNNDNGKTWFLSNVQVFWNKKGPWLDCRQADKLARLLEQSRKEFSELKFGMFIHFNMGTYHEKEWVEPHQDPKSFNPQHLDCSQWARAAKSAGIKYAVLTTKHHDGFCLWDSKTTTYDVASSGVAGRDIVREYCDAFRKEGIEPCLYFSIWDRQQGIQDSIKEKDIAYIEAQLKELLTNYGKIKCLVFDGWGNCGTKWTQKDHDELYAYIKNLQSQILITDHYQLRRGISRDAAYRMVDVFEYEEPFVGEKVPVDNTYVSQQSPIMQSAWFWKKSFPKEKLMSVDDIVDKHLKVVNSRHCNLLINCAPNRDGLMDENVVQRLKEVGQYRLQQK